MRIELYLNDKEETLITTFHDMASNPFNLGDIIHLNVRDLHPVEYSNFKGDVEEKLIGDNRNLQKFFKHSRVKIVGVDKWVDFSTLGTPRLTICYYCRFVETVTIS